MQDILKIEGKVNTAIAYAKIIENEAIEQIRRMCDYELTKGSRIRIMPDVHSGALPERSALKMDQIPVIDQEATGRKIKSLRMAAGISVTDLQATLGFANPQTIYKWQRGDGMPSLDNLVIIAKVFGVKVDDIIIVQIDN